MFVNLLRRGLVLAIAGVSMLGAARAQSAPQFDVHREAVDVSQYPWSAIGKLFNETGTACTAVIVAKDKVLTAAHCVFNELTRRFIQASSLHFLVGYRTGQYSVHARVSSYDIGAGFDPLRYDATSNADWAVLTLTENLPTDIEPLELSQDAVPSGTKAIIAGYPQDRAFAMTADADCEWREGIDGGKLFLHTCRGIYGYSGAPILVRAADNKIEIAGIQVAELQSNGAQKFVAVPAQTVKQALKTDDAAPVALCIKNNIAGYDSRGVNAFA